MGRVAFYMCYTIIYTPHQINYNIFYIIPVDEEVAVLVGEALLELADVVSSRRHPQVEQEWFRRLGHRPE